MKKYYIYGLLLGISLLYVSPAEGRILIKASPEVDGHAHDENEDDHADHSDNTVPDSTNNTGYQPVAAPPIHTVVPPLAPAYSEPATQTQPPFYRPLNSNRFINAPASVSGRINATPAFTPYVYRREPVYTYQRTYAPAYYQRTYEPDSIVNNTDGVTKPYTYTRGAVYEYRRVYVPGTYYRTYQ